jgi:hypothetical protein
MDEQSVAKIHKLTYEINQFANRLSHRIGFFRTMEKSLADTLISQIGEYKSKVKELQLDPTQARSSEETFNRVIIPSYANAVLDSAHAKIEQAKEGYKDTRTRFELSLKADALTIDDIADAVTVYHNEVKRFLELQKELGDYDPDGVNCSNVVEYKRNCEIIIGKLDDGASSLFMTKISTPANFDIKEKSPHQFLGQINVGFERYMPNLVSCIAHEGPFGHNTYDILSANSIFAIPFSHTHEGISILGERIGLQIFYPTDENKDRVIRQLVMTKRRMNDALGAAYEKAAFFDQMKEKEIVDMLQSRISPAEYLAQHISGLNEKREIVFSAASCPYFAGYQTISRMYQAVIEMIKHEPLEAQAGLQSKFLRTMYSGYRPANIIEAHIAAALNDTDLKKIFRRQALSSHQKYLINTKSTSSR